ncbi:MAG: DUF488 domain-containing protein [Steroidobacteraceae bacterium]
MKLFTIGFAGKRAEEFFGRLRRAGVKRIVDVRLNNASQLAGFSKKEDLRYFLQELAGIEYVHLPELAPTREMLDEYRRRKDDWTEYERKFVSLIRARRVESALPQSLLEDACLLCSEDKPHHCHRRLVAEYLKAHWTGVLVEHL